jgi:hypothetical protein
MKTNITARMTRERWILLVVIFLLACSEKKENPPVTDPCLINGYYLRATLANDSWCANTTLFTDLAIVMTINGISSNGASMTLELDDVTVGTFSITEDRNHILYTNSLGVAYRSTNDNPGSLIIQSNDTSANIIQGSFNVTLRNPMAGNLPASGSFRLFYSE